MAAKLSSHSYTAACDVEVLYTESMRFAWLVGSLENKPAVKESIGDRLSDWKSERLCQRLYISRAKLSYRKRYTAPDEGMLSLAHKKATVDIPRGVISPTR